VTVIKIKGDKVAKEMVFPTWTEDELALWLDKDEAACQSWRAGRSEKWEAGDEKLRASHPTREALDAFLDKGCESSKNKSLWKRTRTAKKKAAATSMGEGPPDLPLPSLNLTEGVDEWQGHWKGMTRPQRMVTMAECWNSLTEETRMLAAQKVGSRSPGHRTRRVQLRVLPHRPQPFGASRCSLCFCWKRACRQWHR
jgi:hypothetical protein